MSNRINMMCIGIFLFAGILCVKLFYVQVIDGEKYALKADRQYIAPRSNIFDRGSIYFSENKGERVSAASLKSGYTLAISPKQIVDAEKVYTDLSQVIELDRDVFMARAGKQDDPYEELSRRLDLEVIEKIESFEHEGVVISKDKWRYYPGESMASHVLGFVGYKGNILSGRYGLERYYNDILHRDDNKLYVNFFAEVFSNLTDVFTSYDKSNREGDIITTIEPWVEQALEKELNSVIDSWDAESAGGIIINPANGEIVAMGNLPSFDPNLYNLVEDPHIFTNPLVENVYEMGSIVKPITVAIGLDTGAITSESTYIDKGYVQVGTSRIANYDGRGRGEVLMQEVLNQSLNTGVVHIMNEVGSKRFGQYFLSFGGAKKTGIDLPNEIGGLMSNLEDGNTIEYATASFGQGVAFTPIGMVRALSVLANGGNMITPHIVKEIDYSVGFSEQIEIEEGERVIKEETSEEISRMLVGVVDDALRGGEVKIPGYSIAAKTGTAQIADPDDGGYFEERYLHSFFGYFPAYNPEFLVFLYVVDPKEVNYASETLTTPFMDLTQFLINYYEIPPDR